MSDSVLCAWCEDPKRPATDRMEVSNGSADVILALDLCDEHAHEASNGGLNKRVLKAERVRRLKASMS